MHVSYVVLYVNDAEACRRFWVEQVGMTERYRIQAGPHEIIQVGFADQGFSFQLVPLELMRNNPDGLDLATPSIAFTVSDLDAERARLVAAAEALACGTPVVASRVGGIPEMIGDQFAGFLHEVGDTSTAASITASLFLLSDDEREALRATCRAHAEQTLSPKRPIDQYLAIYASAMR